MHAGNETFEKLGTLGTSANLLVYLTTVFNMKSITATNLINIFNGTCNFGTLLGAFFSDTYFGRYKTLGFASVSSTLVQIYIYIHLSLYNIMTYIKNKLELIVFPFSFFFPCLTGDASVNTNSCNFKVASSNM